MNEQEVILSAENYTFALDIGTRSVIGVVGTMQDDKFKIAAIETMEHAKRAMIDGQIEDIAEVARIAKRVKEKLEERLGFTLERVCVAAAGRALRTSFAEWVMEISPNEPISQETVFQLEMGAVSLASENLNKTLGGQHDFYCVGYSVKRFYLDDYSYSTLVGHKGRVAKAEVIATFLPREVVESLSSAMSKIGLDIIYLTLEPIAAMNAVIPAELRLLNLALVDIGAGTSDIALCEDNTVTAYTMATVAGDEITEEIIRRYLVDFATAESIKHRLGEEADSIEFSDIMGFDYSLPREEILASVEEAVSNLTTTICEKIIECNGHSPAAVFLVGGGSRVPSLCERVADMLGIDNRKVAVGGNNFMKRVIVGDAGICGPEYATPLGIALTAAMLGDAAGFSVMVNGKRRQLFRNSALSFMDVLLLCGYKYTDILGRNGKSLEYELNGERRILRGTHMKPSILRINGEEVSLTSPVKSGDTIEVIPAENGVDAFITAGQLLSNGGLEIVYNGDKTNAGGIIYVSGRRVTPEYEIKNRDSITIEWVSTLDDLCRCMNVPREHASILVNGEEKPDDYKLCEGDEVTLFSTAVEPEPEEVPEAERAYEEIPAPIAFPTAAAKEPEQEPMAKPISVTINGQPRTVTPKNDNSAPLFMDMLTLVDIDPTKPQGDIVLTHNGHTASYLQPVNDGDVIEIYWAERA